MAAGGGMSGSDDTCSLYDTCSTYEWPTGRGERGQEEERDRSSHSSDLDFIADELEANSN
tara:strand:- start:104 stop:283 length:180 start_codon:yes stop_codon:yes gene_type:complete